MLPRRSGLLALELLSRDHPKVVNDVRPLLHELVANDGNEAVRRLDLAEVVLTLKASGVEDVSKFRWLEPPEARSLERALNVAEAMEGRGYGCGHPTPPPRSPWSRVDRLAIVAAAAVVAIGVLWL